ncbi:unnamed protein product, partial [Laminaria digitata]
MRRLPDLKTFTPRGKRARIAFAHDTVMAAISFVAALY